MPEPIEKPIEPSPEAAELVVLKQAHQEVLTKRQKDKARISELESTVSGLQGQLSEAGETLKQVTIDVPLKAMAESMSTVPDLFLEQFSKHYKVEMVKGVLSLFNVDGTPALDKSKKPIPFEREALTKMLIGDDSIHAKTFSAFTIVNRASGASKFGRSESSKRESTTTKPGLQFGLR